MPKTKSASSTGTTAGAAYPRRIPPGWKSRVPARAYTQTIASSWNTIEVEKRMPRYTRPARLAASVPACVTSGKVVSESTS